jgi:hypothetical protein
MADLSPEDFNLLGSALTDLYGQARARPDLGQAAPVATMMGRVTRPGEGLSAILGRLPQETPDAEGLSGLSGLIQKLGIGTGGTGAALAGIAPAVRRLGSKTFTDAAAPAVAPWADILKELVKRGEPLNRRTMRPAIKTSSGVIVGDVAGGHGTLWEAVNPAQQKGAIDGYVDAAGRFMTRDQGGIAAGSLEGIKASLENALFQQRR